MAQRGACAGGCGQHRGDAGQDLHVQRQPVLRLRPLGAFDGFKHRRCHREHAWVAGRDHDDLPALGGQRQRLLGAVQLNPVVRREPLRLAAASRRVLRNQGLRARHIGEVAHDIVGRQQGLQHGGRDLVQVTGAQAGNGQLAAAYHAASGRRPWPCTSTIAK